MKSSKYFLVGMPSSGKSTIGKLLAGQLGLDFIDLDEEIVCNEEMEITQIFKTKGESYFREIERKNLLMVIENRRGFVLATGGGTPCFFNNMELMNDAGMTIYLNISVKDLYIKLSKRGTQKRPLLKDVSSEDLFQELEGKFQQRKKYYERSKICLAQRFSNIAERINEVIYAIKSLEEQSKGQSDI